MVNSRDDDYDFTVDFDPSILGPKFVNNLEKLLRKKYEHKAYKIYYIDEIYDSLERVSFPLIRLRNIDNKLSITLTLKARIKYILENDILDMRLMFNDKQEIFGDIDFVLCKLEFRVLNYNETDKSIIVENNTNKTQTLIIGDIYKIRVKNILDGTGLDKIYCLGELVNDIEEPIKTTKTTKTSKLVSNKLQN